MSTDLRAPDFARTDTGLLVPAAAFEEQQKKEAARAAAEKAIPKLPRKLPAGASGFTPSQTFRADDEGRLFIRKRTIVNTMSKRDVIAARKAEKRERLAALRAERAAKRDG